MIALQCGKHTWRWRRRVLTVFGYKHRVLQVDRTILVVEIKFYTKRKNIYTLKLKWLNDDYLLKSLLKMLSRGKRIKTDYMLLPLLLEWPLFSPPLGLLGQPKRTPQRHSPVNSTHSFPAWILIAHLLQSSLHHQLCYNKG